MASIFNKVRFGSLRRFEPFVSRLFSNNTSGLAAFETLRVSSPSEYVFHVELNRPEKRNAMNDKMWLEIEQCFKELGDSSDCRVVVLSGAGNQSFTAGIDLQDMANLGSKLADQEDVARRSKILYGFVRRYQDCLSSLEKCPKPVIAAIHGSCIGGGLNLICSADIRYCSDQAWFQNKEVEIGMAADVGTLQRMPHTMGSSSLVNELAFTSRKLSALEAKECGFVNRTFDSKEALLNGAFETAVTIAAKSPVAVQGTKRNLIFSRDYGVVAGLEHIAMNNMAMLQSEDFMKALMAQMTKQPPVFSKL